LTTDSTLLSAVLLLVGGFLGVLLGGLLDTRRARWRWKMDARERAYLGFLRAIEDLSRSGADYWVALVSAGVSESEVASAQGELDQRAEELLLTVREVRILGSPRMVKRANEAQTLGRKVIFAALEHDVFPEQWNPEGEKAGMQQTCLLLAEVVEFLAREELALLGRRERRAARKAERRVKV
jgi:hypothetical protein